MKMLLSKPLDDDANITNESAGTGSSVVACNVTVHIWQVPLHPTVSGLVSSGQSRL